MSKKNIPPGALTIDGQLYFPFGIAGRIGGGADVLPTLFTPGGHHIQTSVGPCRKLSTAGGNQLAFLQNTTKSKVFFKIIKSDFMSGRGRKKNLQGGET